MKLIISIFGIAVVTRLFVQIEKLGVISSSKLLITSVVFQLPLYFYLIFKELNTLIHIYIGIFLITFSLKSKIFTFFYQKVFEKLHLVLIDQLILLMRAGKSPQSAAREIFFQLNHVEKEIFALFQPHESVFGMKNTEIEQQNAFYFYELVQILNLKSSVVDQLQSFREALYLKQKLNHQISKAMHIPKAQALISVAIYCCILALSMWNFHFSIYTKAFLFSLMMFILGQLCIFYVGKAPKWKI